MNKKKEYGLSARIRAKRGWERFRWLPKGDPLRAFFGYSRNIRHFAYKVVEKKVKS